MQTQKINLANIQGKLSREDMKKVMAGRTDGTFDCTEPGECPPRDVECRGVDYPASVSCRNGKCVYAVVC